MSAGHRTDGYFDWTRTKVARLRELWARRLSCAEIGLEIGTTKNAVTGMARRLNLPQRRVGITRHQWTAAEDEQLRALVESGAFCNGIASTMGISRDTIKSRAVALGIEIPRYVLPSKKLTPPRQTKKVIVKPQELPAPGVPRVLYTSLDCGRASGCQFPMWPHSAPVPRPPLFCGADVRAIGEPYCVEHHAICWSRA